ncbi:ferredoxin [Mycolicibacterium thermoresistibile]|jgi:ferredoxin|uniref:Ferredoxin n=2 Tax=Mycolicibacterium thermoresistibile TaxID=1797 RepID=G7CFT9_MYCT3|nr:ferredoxin [Mycolicibacterium thermoresistibile]EHI13368.1 putative ferredoxin [Mycolicibacterium thermoresistibile ATCC 19527]MCV7189161.1 ferredoxin [Mycolicibacterium thermoresistibile]GAT14649.1 ferredoxin [Mycolicibacterium thermoresistibile]SNW19876.1 ferredoxin [Mycolicibacterium thermoresistibile]
MRVEVDRELCESNAVCVGVAPDVFELGDDDLARPLVDEVPPDREAAVREAVALCPKVALTLHDS